MPTPCKYYQSLARTHWVAFADLYGLLRSRFEQPIGHIRTAFITLSATINSVGISDIIVASEIGEKNDNLDVGRLDSGRPQLYFRRSAHPVVPRFATSTLTRYESYLFQFIIPTFVPVTEILQNLV